MRPAPEGDEIGFRATRDEALAHCLKTFPMGSKAAAFAGVDPLKILVPLGEEEDELDDVIDATEWGKALETVPTQVTPPLQLFPVSSRNTLPANVGALVAQSVAKGYVVADFSLPRWSLVQWKGASARIKANYLSYLQGKVTATHTHTHTAQKPEAIVSSTRPPAFSCPHSCRPSRSPFGQPLPPWSPQRGGGGGGCHGAEARVCCCR